MLTLTNDLYDLLTEVNLKVNRQITYRKDIDQYKTAEFWALAPDGFGDCEDYALVKQLELKERNVPSYLATCWCYPKLKGFLGIGKREREGYHAVLLVDTDKGTYVLDNRDNAVWPSDQIGYEWHKRQMEDGTWREILS